MEELKKLEPTGTKKKREDKVRRRDCRSLDNVQKEIGNLNDQQRSEALTTKYGELYEEYRSCRTSHGVAEKRCTALQRERDQLQSEQSKLILARSRMESLCRELQRQNKIIKDENLAKIREEEEKRKEIAAKFQTTLNEMATMLQENTEKNQRLRDGNIDMASKMEAFFKQCENGMKLEMELEKQLAKAQMEKAQLELKAEKEIWAQEKKVLQEKILKGEENCIHLQMTIKSLQENLELYSGKYQEFKSSILKSNQVFDDCKSEMNKMTKQILGLEKEVKTWKNRSQKNAQSVLELSSMKQTQDSKLEMCNKKIEQLQKLCRQLQIDRSSYLKLLKNNAIEPIITESNIEEQIAIQCTPQEQMTKKEKHLELLKDNLKALQNKLTSIQQYSSTDLENGVDLGTEECVEEILISSTSIEELSEEPKVSDVENLELREEPKDSIEIVQIIEFPLINHQGVKIVELDESDNPAEGTNLSVTNEKNSLLVDDVASTSQENS